MLFLFIIALLFTFLGVVLTLFIEWHYFNSWLLKQPCKKPPFHYDSGLPKYQLPKELKELVDKSDLPTDQQQSCLALNLFFQFLYKELKDTKKVRRWCMKKLSMEFEELLQKTTTGKLIDQITLRDLTLGTQFPVIKEIHAAKVELHESQDYINELDIVMDLEYSGGFQLSVDADLVLGRSAYLAVKIIRLIGKVRLQLTRTPFTHWSIVFCQEPLLEFKVESQFEGRPFPQITSLIIGQIRRAIKKKHTLPNYKVRFKPFFEKQDVQLDLDEIKNSAFAEGQLQVTIIQCNRLIRSSPAFQFYCTLAVDTVAWVDEDCQQSSSWTIYDVEIYKLPSQVVGITFKQEYIPDKGRQCVIIENIIPDSPASLVDLHKRDVLISINGVKINSFNQTAKLLRQQNTKLAVRIERTTYLKGSHSHEMFSKLDEQILTLKDGDANIAGEEEDDIMNLKYKNDDSDSSSPNSRTPTHGSPVKKILLSAQSGLFNKQKNFDCSKSLLEVTLDRRRKSEGFDTLNKISQDKNHVGASNSDSTTNEEQFKFRKNADVKKTSFAEGVTFDPVWEEKFSFEIDAAIKYLNVVVWCKKYERVEKNQKNEKEKTIKMDRDIQVGQVSIPLLDIALECATNSNGFHQQTFQLKPPSLKPTASRFFKLSSHPGFDESLCYGDITLTFVHKPDLSPKVDKKNVVVSSLLNDSDDETENVIEDAIKDKTCLESSQIKAHVFVGTQFKTATSCHFCGKKIWLKVAFQCKNCKMISHKKCVSKCHSLTICTNDGAKLIPQMVPSRIAKNPEIVTGLADDNAPEVAEVALAGNETAGLGYGVLSITPPGSPKNQRRSIPSLLINLANTAAQAKSGLTRAGSVHNLIPPSQQCSSLSKSLPPSPQHSPLSSRKASIQDNPFPMNNDSEVEEDVESTVQRLLQHPNDEILVSAAKKMGKELYMSLDNQERKAKLNEMVKKVQVEIDAEATNRNELSKLDKEISDPTQKMRFALQISKSDERSRALAVLLLHYYAGIQHCQETEEPNQCENSLHSENQTEDTCATRVETNLTEKNNDKKVTL